MAAPENPAGGVSLTSTIENERSPHHSGLDDNHEPFIYTSVRYDASLRASPENTAASFNISCPFYLLEHHWTRLRVAEWSAQFWTDSGIPPKAHSRPADFLHSLLFAVRQWERSHPKEAEWAEALRVRRRVYQSGRVTTEIYQIPRQPLHVLFPQSLDLGGGDGASNGVIAGSTEPEWTAVLDVRPTEVTDATMYKIWDRSPQSRARADAGILTLGATKEVLMYNAEAEVLDGSNSTPYFHRQGKWVTPVSSSGGLQGVTRRWALEKGLCVEGVVATDSLEDGEVVWFSNGVRGFFRAVYRRRDPSLGTPASDPAQVGRIMRQLV